MQSDTRPFLGKIGFGLSLLPWLAIVAAAFLHLPWGSPFGALVGLLFLFGPPTALAVNIIAVLREKSKVFGIVGLIISGLTCSYIVLMLIMASLHHA